MQIHSITPYMAAICDWCCSCHWCNCLLNWHRVLVIEIQHDQGLSRLGAQPSETQVSRHLSFHDSFEPPHLMVPRLKIGRSAAMPCAHSLPSLSLSCQWKICLMTLHPDCGVCALSRALPSLLDLQILCCICSYQVGQYIWQSIQARRGLLLWPGNQSPTSPERLARDNSPRAGLCPCPSVAAGLEQGQVSPGSLGLCWHGPQVGSASSVSICWPWTRCCQQL